ncbi:mCG144804, partial [Mus musculus]
NSRFPHCIFNIHVVSLDPSTDLSFSHSSLLSFLISHSHSYCMTFYFCISHVYSLTKYLTDNFLYLGNIQISNSEY